MNNSDFLCYDPTVYAVGEKYEIIFRPLPEGDIHAYMLADTHSKVDEGAEQKGY